MFLLVAMALSPAVFGLMRIDEPSILGAVTKSGKARAGHSRNGKRRANRTHAAWRRIKPPRGNSTAAAWQHFKESAREQVERAEQGLSPLLSKNLGDAKMAIGVPAALKHLNGSSNKSTKTAWQQFKDAAREKVERAEERIPERLENAKNAIVDMKDRASGEIDVARRRWLGGEAAGKAASNTSRALPPELCSAARDLALDKATTVYSNLGGLGPDEGRPQSLRFANVFPFSGMHVDMIVTATTKYVGTPAGRNKLVEDFLVINVNSGSSVKVQFSFVDRITGSPVEVPAFLFTIAGLDHQEDGGAKQRVTMGAQTDVYTSPEGSGVSVGGQAYWNTTFVSMLPEEAAASKHLLLKARAMSPKHLSRAISLRMPHLSRFEMKLSVDPGMRSRDFYFSGASNMVCDKQATCDMHSCPHFFTKRPRPWSLLCRGSACTDADLETCCSPVTPDDCQPENTLIFSHEALRHSNLGGFGPDFDQPPTLFFENVFPYTTGTLLDLEVSAVSIYAPGNISMNGLARGRHGSVSLAPGTSVDLNFSFYEHGTRRLLKPSHAFFLSVRAFHETKGLGVNSLRIPSALIKATKLMHADAVGKSTDFINRTVFVSDTHTASNSTPEVSVLLSPKEHFVLTVSSPMGIAGQAFRFTGYSKGGCPPRRSLCERATCPGGHQKRADAMGRRCAGHSCTLEDIGTCCEPIEAAICDAKNIVKLAHDSLLERSLGDYGPHLLAPKHLLLTDILPQSGSVVNMRLSAISGRYMMSSVPQSTRTNDFIKLDVAPGSAVHLKLEFYTEEDAEPLELPMFYLTVADIDRGFGDFSIESVGIINHSYVNVTNGGNFLNSSQAVEGKNWSFFSATEYGDERIGPWFDTEHKRADAKKSLGALFEHVSELEFLLNVSKPKHGNSSRPRSFYIGGQTSLACPVQQASCAAYVCPAKQTLHANAATLSCAGSVCTEADARTCCHASNEDECSPMQAMVIAPHSLVHSNLCGLGPDEGKLALIYGDVFPGSGKKLDLEIEGIRGCAVFDTSRNGMLGSIGNINLQAGAVMGLRFKIVHSYTREPVEDIWPYIVTFLNMEAPEDNASSYVEIAVSNLRSYEVTDRTTLRITNNTFRSGKGSSHPGDSPEHPHALMPRHMARSVALKFDVPSFNVLATASDGFEGGHDLMFAGSSNLACSTLAFCSTAECPVGFEHRKEANITTCLGAACTELDTTTCCLRSECSEERALQFRADRVRYSNLGGYGPDGNREAAIVYADVFPLSGQEVDLEVTAVGEYFLSNVSMNGVDGPFGSVNMGPGSDLTLRFRFVEPGTKTPASVDSFFFSIFNITLPNEDAGKLVSVSSYKWYELPKHTKLREKDHNGMMFFTSAADEEDWRLRGHPNHPLALGNTQLNHSVTFLMPAKSEFTVSASLAAGWLGTNILFAGPSNIICAQHALCSSYQCPAKWELRHDAHRSVCKTQRCNHLDVEQCCVPRSTLSEPRKSHWIVDEDVLPELTAAA